MTYTAERHHHDHAVVIAWPSWWRRLLGEPETYRWAVRLHGVWFWSADRDSRVGRAITDSAVTTRLESI